MSTVVYGITASTDMFVRSEFNNDDNIYACTSGGEEFMGETAISLQALSEFENKQDLRVVICSEFILDILNSLQNIGISIEQSFFFNHTSGQLVPCAELLADKADVNSTLFAFYDLSYNLPCFDVTTFVVLAEIERQKQNKKFIQFVILPSRCENTTEVNVFHDKQDANWRVEKLVKPMFSCLPACIGIDQPFSKSCVDFYKKLNVCTYPDNYFNNPRQLAGDFTILKSYVNDKIKLSNLIPPKQASAIVTDYIRHQVGDKKLITITLREYWSNAEHRNSNVNAWLDFALSLDRNEYYPLIVRDTYKVSEPLPDKYSDLPTYPEASVDLSIRLALYHKAYINMGVDNGPLYPISYLAGARSIIFRFQTNDIPNLSDRSNEKHFFEVGKNHFFNDNPFQINAWMNDSLENIQAQFFSLDSKIKEANSTL
ncbi:hypothetical protein [Pseudoalteromonas piscicida]|uniref:Uncharacterized protein n=1 Tax=Pseudoalteromonas piscicida TaxID=43662 RepID=A0AAD0RFU7_PSEO7|nr:hypothetical protein [Pseudoalteromonas piscicida]ASD67483.1 hypothetical protein B1L02_10960 [Pseudoalteromonas piscicida]AXR01815.1 hypothetical protein D0511_06790 [Pseudoalteromonas piscicida]